IAGDSGEAAVASQPLLESCGSPLGMDENQAAELLRLRPERMKLGVGQLFARDVGADRAAAQAELPHAFLELLGGEIRVLQRHGGKGDEAPGWDAHSSASFSFCILMSARARSRSALYQ